MNGDTSTLDELFNVRGKVALVTGGSRGIGLMIARGLAMVGVRVYITSRDTAACTQAEQELNRFGTCTALPADIGDPAALDQLASELAAREKGLHLLVNNAGTNWGARFDDYPDAAWDKVFAVNVKAMFALTRRLAPLLHAAASDEDPARVINIGSVDGLRVPSVENYAYAASKAAVHHLTTILAQNLGVRRITVNAIAPGPFETKMMKVALDHARAQIEAACPLGRIGRPDDIAGTVIFLASRAGAYITGATLPVDGGLAHATHSAFNEDAFSTVR